MGRWNDGTGTGTVESIFDNGWGGNSGLAGGDPLVGWVGAEPGWSAYHKDGRLALARLWPHTAGRERACFGGMLLIMGEKLKWQVEPKWLEGWASAEPGWRVPPRCLSLAFLIV